MMWKANEGRNYTKIGNLDTVLGVVKSREMVSQKPLNRIDVLLEAAQSH